LHSRAVLGMRRRHERPDFVVDFLDEMPISVLCPVTACVPGWCWLKKCIFARLAVGPLASWTSPKAKFLGCMMPKLQPHGPCPTEALCPI
jgi:hypothetical protein